MTLHSKPKLKASRRLIEYPDDRFVVIDVNLYCNYCDLSHVSWTQKSDVLKHIQDVFTRMRVLAIAMASVCLSVCQCSVPYAGTRHTICRPSDSVSRSTLQ